MPSDRRSPARMIATRCAAGVALSVVAALLSGCGGPGVGDVTGTVTYKGKPVVYGSVGFVGADGLPRSTRINPDGTYTVKDVAVGEAKITVDSPKPVTQAAGGQPKDGRRPGGRGEEPAPKDLPKIDRGERGEAPEVVDPEIAKKWLAIPESYADVAKTKLRFSVRKGPNTHDIQLD